MAARNLRLPAVKLFCGMCISGGENVSDTMYALLVCRPGGDAEPMERVEIVQREGIRHVR